ncbi:substrate-binding periplasmic protein [Colwellia sp. MEBiC06753]
MVKQRFWRVLLLVLSTNAYAREDISIQHTLTLATTAWCPYTCDSNNYPHGVIGHYLTTILAEQNISLRIVSFPWARAIKLATDGSIDGLLTAVPSEAPQLIFSGQPISHYQVCFYTASNSTWQYQQPLNFSGLTLGVIKGYGYGSPLDEYLTSPPANNAIVELSGQQGATRLAEMILAKRIDVFAEDQLVVSSLPTTNKFAPSMLRNAGCMSSEPFYLALSDTEQHRALLHNINAILADDTNQAWLETLFKQLAKH